MTGLQKIIKYCAVAFAVFLMVSIIGGIIAAIGTLSVFFGDHDGTGELETYTVSGEITSLKVDITAADFQILSAADFQVESNISDLDIREKDGVLLIEDREHLRFNSDKRVLKLYIPENMVFDRIDIAVDAGKTRAAALSADEVVLDLGVGSAEFDQLLAERSARINGGAGEIVLRSSSLHDAELDIGAGRLVFRGALSGRCSVDTGVGAARLELTGREEDYFFKADKGLGVISVNGKKLADHETSGSGETNVSLSNGVGEIKVVFEED